MAVWAASRLLPVDAVAESVEPVEATDRRLVSAVVAGEDALLAAAAAALLR